MEHTENRWLIGDQTRDSRSPIVSSGAISASHSADESLASSAGGVSMTALDHRLMLPSLPGVFFAGEMLDWEAPTGGYLLTASLATGRGAGLGAAAWLRSG